MLETLLYLPREERGRQWLECLQSGIITEIGLRAGLMAHCATQIANSNGVDEPSYLDYGSDELEADFDRALFERPAQLTTLDKDRNSRRSDLPKQS
jgi:hypothetical protein